MDGKAITTRTRVKSRSGSEKRKRTHAKPVRFTNEELTEINEAASNAGLTFSSYARVQILGRPVMNSVRRPPVEKELLARALGQLGKVGSNLNQIAFAVNIGEQPGPDVNDVLTEVRQAAAAVLKCLGRGE